ncbi:MAG: enoyl-CoA hydratase-related protein [Armatimonadota bacterium]|nr:enoyl-CoA hydratase-related protein [Armatimonadota bacterium]
MNVLRVEVDGSSLSITLSRPEVHNALSADLIDALGAAFRDAARRPGIRYVVLSGEGPSFCAGADLHWMRSTVHASLEDNRRDAARLAEMLDAVVGCPRPVVARVHGAVLGGGMGLVAACDLAVAEPGAVFGLTEVRLGLVPAMIFPFLLRKVSRSHLLWAALTGERFPAHRALEMGLVNAVADDPDDVVAGWARSLQAGGPEALAQVKHLFDQVHRLSPQEAREFTVDLIARLRTGPEGQEGMRAFLERRRPSWMATHDSE